MSFSLDATQSCISPVEVKLTLYPAVWLQLLHIFVEENLIQESMVDSLEILLLNLLTQLDCSCIDFMVVIFLSLSFDICMSSSFASQNLTLRYTKNP